ncbi:MAG: hypothetical protein ACRC7O_06230 [Fimbriiglobus sp.]
MKHFTVAKRKAACSEFKTQVEVDAAIENFIRLAVAAEGKRDAAEWESKEYWKFHDIAMKWHGKAEVMMP